MKNFEWKLADAIALATDRLNAGEILLCDFDKEVHELWDWMHEENEAYRVYA